MPFFLITFLFAACPKCGYMFSQLALDGHFSEQGINDRCAEVGSERERGLRRTLSDLETRLGRIREGCIGDAYDEREYLELTIPLSERAHEMRQKIDATGRSDSLGYVALSTNRQKKYYAEMRIKRIVVDPLAKEIRRIEYRTEQSDETKR